MAGVTIRWTLLLVWSMKHLAALPWASIPVRAPPWWLVVLFYAGVGAWLGRRRLRLSRATVLVLGCAGLPVLAGWWAWSAPPAALELWQLAVPHGACMVGRCADGPVFLVNAGSRSGQFTQRVLEPFLRSRGIGRIDAAIFTSLDTSHGGAMADLADRLVPRMVAGPAHDPARHAFAEDLPPGLPLTLLVVGQRVRIGRQTTLDVLWPPDVQDPDAPPGQKGMMLLLRQEARPSVVIAGARADAALLKATVNLQAVDAVLLVGPGRPADATRAAAGKLTPGVIVQDGLEQDTAALELPDGPATVLDLSQGYVHLLVDERGVHAAQMTPNDQGK